jgi:predicted RND superfamily exporter protein
LRELGGVVALGIVATLLASVFAAAPFLAAFVAGSRPRRRCTLWAAIQRLVAWVTTTSAAYPRAILVGTALATLLAGVGIRSLALDSDPRTLRPADHPLLAAERTLQAEFGLELGTTTVVVRGVDLDAALDAAGVATDLLRARLGPDAEVTSPSDWLLPAPTAARRIAGLGHDQLAAAAPTLERALDDAGLAVAAFAPFLDSLRGAASGAIPPPPPRTAWPDWLAAAVREGPAGAAAAIQVRLRGEHGTLPEGVVAELQSQVPGVAIASAARVGEELHALALGDLRRLGFAGLALVMLVVVVSFRGDFARGALALLPVVMGTVWAFGIWGGLGRSLDLVCVATLPVLAGIGIDDGLHILHGARARPGEGVRGALLWAGPPMLVANVTTVAGFASLAVSRVPALRNAGMLIAVGISACLVASLVILPAIEALRARKGR